MVSIVYDADDRDEVDSVSPPLLFFSTKVCASLLICLQDYLSPWKPDEGGKRRGRKERRAGRGEWKTGRKETKTGRGQTQENRKKTKNKN